MLNPSIIYARVSTEDQLEKYGLPSQLRACRAHAESLGLSVIEEITDDGISGSLLERPGLDRLRKMVAAGGVHSVLVFDVDRLSRDLFHLLQLKPEIERNSKLEFVATRFENSPSGDLFFNLRGSIARYERAVIRERTMRGRRERASEGKIVGGRTAYGYRYSEGKLIPDEEQAKTVRDIFGSYEAGLNIRMIARRLRQNGVPSWQGGEWGHSSVRRVLVNETYAGVAYYGTLQREGKKLTTRKSGPDRIPMPVPALISRGQWERVQSRLATNFRPGRQSTKYLLRGLFYCSCGRRMSGNCRRGSLSYRCNGRDAENQRRAGATSSCTACVSAVKVDAAV